MPGAITVRRTQVNRKDPRLLYEDTFPGNVLNDVLLVKTDSESKITVSNGNLVFSGGKATPGDFDPMALKSGSITLKAGLSLVARIKNAATLESLRFGLVNKTNPAAAATDIENIIYMDDDGVLRHYRLGAGRVLVPTYTANTYLWVLLSFNATQVFCYVSSNGITWPLAWISTWSTATVWPGFWTYQGGASADYIRVYQGYARPAVYSGTPTAPTPTAGAELLTNPGFEGAYVAGLAPNWTKGGTPTVTEEGVTIHGGSAAQKIESTADGQGVYASVGLVAGNWYAVSGWANVASGGMRLKLSKAADGSDGSQATSSAASFAQLRFIKRVAASVNYIMDFEQNGGSASTFYADDASLTILTLSTCLTLASDPGTRYGVVDSAPTLTSGTQCGHWIWVDDADPSNAVLAYQDGVSAYLEKLVAGTYTQLIKNTATYGAAKGLRTVAVLDGSTPKVALYYDTGSGLVQQGTTQSITDSGFGTGVYAFSTLSTNTPGAMAVETGINV